MKKRTENDLYVAISNYLRLQYPNTIFHFDSGSGAKMSIGMAVRQKRINPHRGYPDLFIAEAKGKFNGFFLEIKKEGTRLTNKKGQWATPHLKEQGEMIDKLQEAGYYAQFAVGFDNCKSQIDYYMNLQNFDNLF